MENSSDTPIVDADTWADGGSGVEYCRSETARKLERDNRQLRLWFAHCYAGHTLYCDDGELQDSREHPFIDFKRDSIDEIRSKMQERTARALNTLEAQESLRALKEAASPHQQL